MTVRRVPKDWSLRVLVPAERLAVRSVTGTSDEKARRKSSTGQWDRAMIGRASRMGQQLWGLEAQNPDP